MKQLLLVLTVITEGGFQHIWFEDIEAWSNLADKGSVTIRISLSRGNLKTTLNPFHFLCTPNVITMILDMLDVKYINTEQIGAGQKVEVRNLISVASIYKRDNHTVLEIQYSNSAVFVFETI